MTIEIKYGALASPIGMQLIAQGYIISESDAEHLQTALSHVSWLYIHEFISSARCRDILGVIHKRIVKLARPIPKETE